MEIPSSSKVSFEQLRPITRDYIKDSSNYPMYIVSRKIWDDIQEEESFKGVDTFPKKVIQSYNPDCHRQHFATTLHSQSTIQYSVVSEIQLSEHRLLPRMIIEDTPVYAKDKVYMNLHRSPEDLWREYSLVYWSYSDDGGTFINSSGEMFSLSSSRLEISLVDKTVPRKIEGYIVVAVLTEGVNIVSSKAYPSAEICREQDWTEYMANAPVGKYRIAKVAIEY